MPETTANAGAVGGLGWRVLATLPSALPLAVAGYGLVAVALLVVGSFRAVLVLPLGLGAAAAAVLAGGLEPAIPTARHPSRRAEYRVCDLLALAGATAAALVNLGHHAQDIAVTRDPAVYSAAGQWLVHHPSLLIPTHQQLFGPSSGVAAQAPGFFVGPSGALYAQGYHLLPTLLASVGWLAGGYRALGLPALLGAAALLAVYGYTRRVARPRWALLTTTVLAVSLPELFYSRDTYTEALDQLLVFGALGLLWAARERGRSRDALLAGLVAGASCLSRIDGYLTLDLLAPVLGFWLATTPRGQRARGSAWTAAFLAGAAVPVAVSWADGTWLSPGYVAALHHELVGEVRLGVALTLLGAAVVALGWTSWPLRLSRRVGPTLAWLGAASVLVSAAVLAIRPLVEVDEGRPSVLIAAVQRAQHLAVQPGRTYAEHTVAWLVWYLGLPAVLLGTLGLALLAARAFGGRRPELLPVVTLTFGIGLLYLVNPLITPEQLFAVRRFVPVVLPGLLVCAAAVLDLIPSARWGGAASVASVPLLLVPALLTSAPLALDGQFTPQEQLVSALCAALPAHAGVIFLGGFGGPLLPVERGYCGHPAVDLSGPAQLAQPGLLAAVGAALRRHGADPMAVAGGTGGLRVDRADPPRPLLTIFMRTWAETLDRAPSSITITREQLVVARVLPDGRLAAAPPVAPG